ncbi:MAG: response regulator transcription factor [Kineosporiaceae bacterium]|nr:response regulator transcription factor [Kineosporiaceae bacterium]MBK8076052.1 response regulator transcription factor [Kineosporiaceae bacterium]
MTSILLVEDDATVRETVGVYLRRAGYEVRCVADGASAVEEFAARGADLVLLDLMLPQLGGFDVLRRVRALRRETPVIMLTARGQEHERVQGLQVGADDYVTKPFSLRELELRVRSVLRRSAPSPHPVDVVVTSGDLTVDLAGRRVLREGAELALTSREFDLLAWLVRHPGVVAGRDQLIREVWGWDVGDESTVTVHVRRLREKIEPDPSRPSLLVTVFGRGYRWDGDA